MSSTKSGNKSFRRNALSGRIKVHHEHPGCLSSVFLKSSRYANPRGSELQSSKPIVGNSEVVAEDVPGTGIRGNRTDVEDAPEVRK